MSTTLVVKDNKLINARYNLTVAEMRLFLSMITQIQMEDEAFKDYRIHISSFVDTLSTSAKNLYKRAEETSKTLMEKVLRIEEEDGPLQVAFVSSAKYYKGKGYVDVSFDPKLKPYLIKLKEKFTAYDIRNVLQLQSAHSIRIYELLKQYEKIGERTISVIELKEVLGVAGQYARYNDFKRFVLHQAQKELKKHCDIAFEFEERKQGRRIEEIRFLIKRGSVAPSPANGNDESELVKDLLRMGLAKNQALKIVADKSEDNIRAALDYTQKRYHATKGTEKEIQNISGYLLRMLESEIGVPEFVEKDKEKEEELEKKLLEEKQKKEAQAQEQALISELKEKYQASRKEIYLEKVAQASEQEWKSFEAYAKENVFLNRKYVSNGQLQRDEEGIKFWFGSFLTDEEWPDTPENFIKWTYESEGYQLETEMQAGEVGYRVHGRQEKLF